MPAILTPSPSPRSRRTLAELQTRILRNLGLAGTNKVSTADLTDWLNDAQDEIARLSGWFRGSYQGNVTAGAAEYDLPAAPAARFLSIEEVYVSSAPVAYLPFDQLQQYYRRFRDQTAATARWWSTRGGSSIYLHPKPSATVVDALVIYGIALPPYVSQDGDKLYVPHGLEQAAIDYCMLQGSLKDAHGEGARRLQYLAAKWQEWEARIISSPSNVSVNEVIAMGEDAVSDTGYGPGYIPPGTIVSAPV